MAMGSLHIVDLFVSGQMKDMHIKRNAENVALQKKRNLTKRRIHRNQRKGTKYSKTEVLANNQRKKLKMKVMEKWIQRTVTQTTKVTIKILKHQRRKLKTKVIQKTESKDIDTDNKSENQDSEIKDNETPQTSHQEGSDE